MNVLKNVDRKILRSLVIYIYYLKIVGSMTVTGVTRSKN